ncbi:MAG: hypothetical protein AAF222_04845 [Pseudomonadota bacterium]
MNPVFVQIPVDIPAPVKRPKYDRAALRRGIIHDSVASFHRAHQAWCPHRLLQAGRAQDWANIGAGVRALGTGDAAPVTHENFRQWVIEDDFCRGRPDWDRVGATYSDDVHGHETRKLRLLHACHQFLTNAAKLLGLQTLAQTMLHHPLRSFFRKNPQTEIAPLVKPVPGMKPQTYTVPVERRISNPTTRDTVRRVVFDGNSRHLDFVLPTIRDARTTSAPTAGLAMAETIWSRMCLGHREDGSRTVQKDPMWKRLKAIAQSNELTPLAWLKMDDIYRDLVDWPDFAAAFETAHRKNPRRRRRCRFEL